MNELGTFLTAAQLAKTLNISRSNVLSLAQRGILPAGIKLGHSRRWKLEDVKQALQTLEGGQSR